MSVEDPAREARDLLKQADLEIRKADSVERRAKRLLTVLAAADYCGVSPRTMLNWIKNGAIFAVPIPPSRGKHRRQHYRVPIAEVEKIARARS